MTSVLRDVVNACRRIARGPGVPLVIVLSLGFAHGINTSLFSVINAIWFAPWPVEGADRLRVIRPDVSVAEWRHWSDHARSVSLVAAHRSGPPAQVGGRRVQFDFVSANYFEALGARVTHGRTFAAEGDAPEGTERLAVISYDLWQTAFRGDPLAVGRAITLEPVRRHSTAVTVTIAGVAAPGFHGPDRLTRQLWLPLSAMRLFDAAEDPPETQAPLLRAFARLAPTAAETGAQAELATLNRTFRSQQGDSLADISVHSTDRASLSPPPLQTQLMLGLLLGGVVFITLIACANVSNLLMARGHERRREIAVRLAVGASRARVVRELLTESALLVLAAAWLGTILALWLPDAVFRAFVQSTSSELAEMIRLDVSLDHRVFLWVLGMSVISCLAFGLWPALRSTEGRFGQVLRESQGRPAGLIASLLGYQTIVSVMALAIAGLILRSGPVEDARTLRHTLSDISVVRIDLGPEVSETDRRGAAAVLAERLNLLAGPAGAAGVIGAAQSEVSHTLQVTPDYFSVLRMPWLSGRAFAGSDPDNPVMVVNDAFARRFWPGQDARGQVLMPDTRVWDTALVGREVVGIVSDSHGSLPVAYVPARAGDVRTFLARVPGDRIRNGVTPLVTRLHPSATIQVAPGSTWLPPSAGASLIAAYSMLAFGGMALLLGTTGLFSLVEYAVRHRTREIGIRIALGADAREVIREVMAVPLRALVRGLLVGSAGTVAVGFILQRAGMPTGVEPLDLVTYASVAGILAAAALVAGFGPTRRALRIAPCEALREE